MTKELDLDGFDFRSSFRDIAGGMVLKPLLHNYLYDASFPEFSVHFEKQQMERSPDNFFHPSTHPLMSEAVLYRYLSEPDTFPVEKKQYMSTLSVTIGKVMHDFVETCLTDLGVRPPEMQICQVCPPKLECKEAGLVDQEIGERGHVDGFLDLSVLGGTVPADRHYPILEFKTSNEMKLSKVEDMNIEIFKAKWPAYYAQVQSYMRMRGAPYAIVLFLSLGYPWEMREFHIPFDLGFATEVRNKYRRVRQAVADQQQPMCCGFKSCEVWDLCRKDGFVR